MDHVTNLSRIDVYVRSTFQIPRLLSTVIRLSNDDTGESGEAYDAEAKSEAWAKAQTAP